MVAGTSAAKSDLMVGDIITIVNDEFVAGLEQEKMLKTLWGVKGASLELTASRRVSNVVTRVFDVVMLDDVKHDALIFILDDLQSNTLCLYCVVLQGFSVA